jgi:NADH-quinone oxidoreductase subunit M
MIDLLLVILVPIIGAALCGLLPRRHTNWAKGCALAFSLLSALFAIGLAVQFPWSTGEELKWSSSAFFIENLQFGLKLGCDPISLWLVLLTALLTPLAILSSFASIKDREKEYYAWMLLLLAAMNGVFVARDMLLFYIFFELTLVPMFFIIGIWGGPERRYAAGKFFLFTFTGSVFTLAGIIYIALSANTFDLYEAIRYTQMSPDVTANVRFWLLLAFLAGFAVKVPLFPVHTWLPLAHTEAPTAGSVILAGVLLKLGTYGLLRLAVPIAMPDAVATVAPWIGALCVIGVIYGALVAWVQTDIKKLVAYSSVSHLGFCVLGLFALNTIGIEGSVLYMINHGLSTGALFLVIGMIYDRYHTRDINKLSGLARIMPRMAFFFILFTLASIGLPGLNGFVSEFLTILGAFTSKNLGIGYGSLAALGIILGAVYMLHMCARVIWGPLKTPVYEGDAHEVTHAVAHGPLDYTNPKTPDKPEHEGELPPDLNAREMAILIPIALACIILGVKPNIILQTIEKPAMAVTQIAPPMAAPVKKVIVRAAPRPAGRQARPQPATRPAQARPNAAQTAPKVNPQ